MKSRSQANPLIMLTILILCLPSLVFSFPIPDSGQTKCYNNESEIPCPNPGEDFYGQDGIADFNQI